MLLDTIQDALLLNFSDYIMKNRISSAIMHP
jgi:hypothetical protein